MPCAAVSQEMASIAGASGLQMVGRRRCQSLFEEALLKTQRQEDVGMRVQDLLPQLSPHQFHQHSSVGAAPGSALPPCKEGPALPHLPRKGTDKMGRSSQRFLCPAKLRGEACGDRTATPFSAQHPRDAPPAAPVIPGETSPELLTATHCTIPTSWQQDAAIGNSRQYNNDMTGNSAKKPSSPSLELKIPTLLVPRDPTNGVGMVGKGKLCSSPVPAQSSRSRGPSVVELPSWLIPPQPLNSEAAEIMWLHQSHPDLLPPIAACVTGTPSQATLA